MPKIAILYAKEAEQDQILFQNLEKYLSPHYFKNCEFWTESNIPAGSNIAVERKKQLIASDIVVLLVSIDLVNYLLQGQDEGSILDLLKDLVKGDKKIVGILLRQAPLDAIDIENFTVIPDSGKSISETPQAEIDVILTSIVEQFKIVVDEVRLSKIRIAIPTWSGYAPGVHLNGGFAATEASTFYKHTKTFLEFKVMDDPSRALKALEDGDVDLLWTTVDSFVFMEALNNSKHQPQIVFFIDRSRGADVILAKEKIRRKEDLKGCSIVMPSASTSLTFCLHILNEVGIESKDIKISTKLDVQEDKERVNILLVDLPDDAIEEFRTRKELDAVVTYSPFAEICENIDDGVQIITSTAREHRQAIVSDVLVANKEYVEANKSRLVELFTFWLAKAQLLNESEAEKKDAIETLVNSIIYFTDGDLPNYFKSVLKVFLMPYFRQALEKIILSDFDENVCLFSGDPEFSGKAIFEKAKRTYLTYYDVINSITTYNKEDIENLKWEAICNDTIIREIKKEHIDQVIGRIYEKEYFNTLKK